MAIEIIYKDENYVAINKPHGLLTHKTSIAMDADTSALYLLKTQMDNYLYTVHRLDRKTSGILVFALKPEAQSYLSGLFRDGKVHKSYLAIVRGFTDDEDIIDYSITSPKGKLQEAVTHYTTLERYQLPIPFGQHDSSRYSLVKLTPETGRFHQLRKHMAHIFHPIIGDRPHGCNKQNRLFKDKFGLTEMMLHAETMVFSDRDGKCDISIKAEVSPSFSRIHNIMKDYIV